MSDKIQFLKSVSIIDEASFNNSAKPTGNCLRLSADAINSVYGNLNVKQIYYTNSGINQTRFTLASPSLKLAENENIKLGGSLENWTTIKFDKDFNYQDAANSFRPKLKMDLYDVPILGDIQAYSAFKFDSSLKDLKEKEKPAISFNGAMIGLQKNIDKYSIWGEWHVPPDGMQSPSGTSFAIGVGYKLFQK